MILTIAGKELKALFASPLAWVLLTIMQVLLAYTFLRRLDDFLQIQPQLGRMASPPGVTELVAAPTFATAAAILLFAVPLLGMRSIAEERRNQTMVFLTSAPVSLTEISTSSPDTAHASSIVPSCAVNFTALLSRLITIWPSFSPSTLMVTSGPHP